MSFQAGEKHLKYRHGLADTHFYWVWQKIKSRCQNKNDKAFKNYGGRGITMCNEWVDFVNFKNDMYASYLKFMKVDKPNIDRVDNSLGYNKDNCRWTSYQENNNNRRSVRMFEINGVEKSLREWADQSGIRQKTLYARIFRYKWPIEKAIT